MEEALDWESNAAGLPFLTHMLAGSVAGLVEHGCSFPFDTLKVRATQTLAQAESSKLSGVREVRGLIREVGLAPLWRGISSIALGCVPAHAAYFSIYEASKRYFNGCHLVATATTGVVATLAHDLIMTPMDGSV